MYCETISYSIDGYNDVCAQNENGSPGGEQDQLDLCKEHRI